MAATIAEATGIDNTREKHTHRLGSQGARVRAATYKTFAYAYVDRDGSGYVEVIQHGNCIHSFRWDAE